MKKIILAAAILAVSPALAQEAAPTPEYTLRVTPTDLNNIGTALNELPKRIADPLIDKLSKQVAAQAAADAKKQADAAEAAKKAAAEAPKP